MSANLSTVRLSCVGDVAYLTLDRPAVRNALAFRTHHELGRALDAVSSDPAIRFVVLRGQGGNFSSGGDLSDLSGDLGADYLADYWQRMNGTVLRVRSMPQIVIAMVEGAAIGAGAALALAADIVLADREARFRWSFVHLGLIPDAGSSVLLPRIAGISRSRDLLLTGRWVDAQEAHRIGLIARISAPGELDRSLEGLLDELRQASSQALAMTKSLLEGTTLSDLAAGVRSEGAYQVAAASSGEYRSRVTQRSGRSRRSAGRK